MLRSLVRLSESEVSIRTPSLADFITITSGLKFSVHTALLPEKRSSRPCWHPTLAHIRMLSRSIRRILRLGMPLRESIEIAISQIASK